jgi:IS30 family transposase
MISGLQLDWSPEQIANTIARDVSISTIYRAFHNKTLTTFAKHFRILTFQRGWRKNHKRGNSYKGAKSIHERPKHNRKEFGHWELDSLVFCRKEQKVLAVFVERSSGYLIAILLNDKGATAMKEAILSTFSKLPAECRKTLTVDRGKEFELWEDIESTLPGTLVYFCDAGKPYQKGTVENLNGLLRQYYPKYKSTLAPTPENLSFVIVRLNNRPRKRLNFATPYQKFSKMCCT